MHFRHKSWAATVILAIGCSGAVTEPGAESSLGPKNEQESRAGERNPVRRSVGDVSAPPHDAVTPSRVPCVGEDAAAGVACPSNAQTLDWWAYWAVKNARPVSVVTAEVLSQHDERLDIGDPNLFWNIAWAEVRFTIVSALANIDPALKQYTITITIPGCYATQLTDAANEYQHGVAKQQPQRCFDPYDGHAILSGAPFVIIGALDAPDKVYAITDGIVTASESLLDSELSIAELATKFGPGGPAGAVDN